ncbi:myosin-3-like isoform X2 [Mizuhopecten yessoensis]|uniref:myosin-3-like isoform X2 n=1 Tax=Mizuhopecten yessoensis TaxID=6573 RepID=UPI000B45B1B8|nr:myosin-3-like isoform X2 [Mizuhopecten yessoensis]
MSSLRNSFRRGKRESKRRNNQLTPREIKADDVHESLDNIKKTTKDCKAIHRKWEKDKHFEQVNNTYLTKANTLIGYVDEYRQQLDLSWPNSKEVEDLKDRNYKLAREKEDADYFLEEAQLEIKKLKDRLGEPQTSGRRRDRQKKPENMPKRPAEREIDKESEPFDDHKRARKDSGSLDRRDPSREPIPRHDSRNSQRGRKESRSNNEAVEKEIEELKKKVEKLQEENKSLSEGRASAVKALNAARDEAARNKQQMESSDASVASYHQTIDQLKRQCSDLNVSLNNERQSRSELQQSLQHSQSKEENLRDTIDRLQRNLSSERQAKDEALIRLSAVAGNKLRDNNPAITDLSDPNRPMKLAEKVSELYDNEWTNAMENLENDCKIEEVEAIKLLLDIVKNVFTKFEEIGDAQTDFITSLELPVAVPDIDDLRDTARPLLNTGMLTKLPAEITKPLKDYRKTSCGAVSPLLFEVMKSRLQKLHNMDADTIKACDQFIKDTVSYVWMMRVQDPPVHIEWEFSHGEKFDHDRLRSYTKGGDRVNYVVWPILYLHKGGPMLAKGVAQGMKTKPK